MKNDKKQYLLEELYKPYQACQQCPLGSLGRSQVVFGQGNVDARIMLIGEAPGAQEDIQGRPFVGRSGKFLMKVLEQVGLTRNMVFITNIVKCRPPGNRAPTSIESNACFNLLLLQQIQIIKPLIICTLGSIATQSFLEEPIKISLLRGSIIPQKKFSILPTYHPSYALRDPKHAEKLQEDLKKAFLLAYQ